MVAFGRQLGLALKAQLRSDSAIIVTLEGDLGAGKTTLSRGVLQGFGHTGSVKSPTYTLVEPYQFDDCSVHHFDLYRLGDPEELEFMGIRDYLTGFSLCLVEWPSRAGGILPEADFAVTVTAEGEGRNVHIESF